jgi:hypothetical protein
MYVMRDVMLRVVMRQVVQRVIHGRPHTQGYQARRPEKILLYGTLWAVILRGGESCCRWVRLAIPAGGLDARLAKESERPSGLAPRGPLSTRIANDFCTYPLHFVQTEMS